MSEGWPEGWERKYKTHAVRLLESGRELRARVLAIQSGGYFPEIEGPVCPTAEEAFEMARRAVWAMEPRKEIDREELAKALHDAYENENGQTPWGDRSEVVRHSYIREADTAIRLLVGSEARVDRIEALTKIEALERRDAIAVASLQSMERREWEVRLQGDAATKALRALLDGQSYSEDGMNDALREQMRQVKLRLMEDAAKITDREQRNAALTATANAAVERAEAAEGVLKFMEVEVTRMSRERDAATARAQKAEEMRDNLTSLQRRAEEAEVRAARAEKALKVANEDGAEVQRLRRALDAAARGAAHLTTAISEMTGGGDA